jgi:2-polyprenyl-6-methoxyphenol hydroxylase-like FAD-dependent oxidoreductase
LIETQVLIVGAGPVGLTLALDLGQRGVRCVLIERNVTSIRLPKMERCNARTMEIYRRLGIGERIRDAGLPRGAPMDAFLATSMSAATGIVYPSVASQGRDCAHNDGRPPSRIS